MCRARSEGDEVPAQNRFLERLETGPVIVGDGGMGALLSSAVPRLRSPEEANLRAPEAVVSLHVSFINAGAELIETNTFGANRRKLAHNFLDDELESLNSADRKSTRLNSSHSSISYAVFCLKKKNKTISAGHLS